MERTINGYRYTLPHLVDLRETEPGYWEGHLKDGTPFWVMGGTRSGARRDVWWTVCPTALNAPQRDKSLVAALRHVDEAAAARPEPQPEPEVCQTRRKRARLGERRRG